MIKNAQYNEFEVGFLKEAAAAGCDTAFLRGYIDQADEIVNIWKEAFDELAEKSGDPLYRYKLANEILYFNSIIPELEKKAGAMDVIKGLPQQFQSAMGSMNSTGLGG